jgi:hypothetical protein
MGRWIWRLAIALAALLLGSLGWAIVAMRQADDATLISLTYVNIRQDAWVRPAWVRPITWIIEQGLYAFHPTAEEVQDLNRKAGADGLIFYIPEPQARRLLAHYIAAGLDINRRNLESPLLTTALHTAAWADKASYTRVLLDFGARPDLRDAKGRTPLDLARQTQKEFPNDPDAAERVRMLEAAEQDWAKRLGQPASAPR